MEAARRVSLAEAEAHQIRASQIAAGASSSCTVETAGGTTDGAVVAEDITEGVQIAEDTMRVSRLQRMWVPGNRTHQLVNRRRYAPLHLPL